MKYFLVVFFSKLAPCCSDPVTDFFFVCGVFKMCGLFQVFEFCHFFNLVKPS